MKSNMIRLLFALVFSEMALFVALVFKTPMRKLVIMALDKLNRHRGPIVVKTVAGTALGVTISAVYNVVSIRRRWIQEAEINPTDQVLLAQHLLEASLMGFALFLALMIDRLDHCIREFPVMRKTMEALKKQNRVLEDGKNSVSKEIKPLREEMSRMRGRIKQLEAEIEVKIKEAGSAETNAMAMKKQLEGVFLEYDRLLKENLNILSQLQYLDRNPSFSESKKVI